jgi:hypothetical protein
MDYYAEYKSLRNLMYQYNLRQSLEDGIRIFPGEVLQSGV